MFSSWGIAGRNHPKGGPPNCDWMTNLKRTTGKQRLVQAQLTAQTPVKVKSYVTCGPLCHHKKTPEPQQ